MRFSFCLSCAFVAGLTSLIPQSALAAEPEPAKADKGDDTAGLKGFELMLRPAFGGAPSDSPVKFAPASNTVEREDLGSLVKGASPWGSGFIGQAFVGYRFLPFMSGGLRAGFRNASGSSLDDTSTNLSRSGWDAGFYVRFYPGVFSPTVSKYIDPWVSVGVGYQSDKQSFKRTVSGVVADGTIDHHAVAVPIGIGVDYRILKFLSVGPSFELTVNNPVAGCFGYTAPGFADANYCSNSNPGKDFVKAENYLTWSLGLDVKATF